MFLQDVLEINVSSISLFLKSLFLILLPLLFISVPFSATAVIAYILFTKKDYDKYLLFIQVAGIISVASLTLLNITSYAIIKNLFSLQLLFIYVIYIIIRILIQFFTLVKNANEFDSYTDARDYFDLVPNASMDKLNKMHGSIITTLKEYINT